MSAPTRHTASPVMSASARADSRADKSTNDRMFPKKRAPVACMSCRQRKVRCDVSNKNNGTGPCTNCELDNIDCTVEESRRRKRREPPSPATPLARDAEARRAMRRISSNSADSSATLRPTIPAGESIDYTGGVPNSYGDQIPQWGIHADPGLNGASPDPGVRAEVNHVSPMGQAGGGYQAGSPHGAQVNNGLPGFIKPLPQNLTTEDIEFLAKKGAFALPNREQQSALLQAYVEFVHPYLPVLDLHEFLEIISSGGSPGRQLSLLLYQAVIFTASAFVDGELLIKAGFENRRKARESFFRKARLLYDFDYESDRLAIVQALLHMSYWYETPDDQKDTWHWMGVAVSLAHTLGLHNNATILKLPEHTQRLWRRIWWSCYLRDRLVALGMRRPVRIKDEDFDVPILEESDFEPQELSAENNLLPKECILVRRKPMQCLMAQMCVQMVKLCIIISQMLKAQYSVLNRDALPSQNTENSSVMLCPKKDSYDLAEVARLDDELKQWPMELPPACQYKEVKGLDAAKGFATMAVQRNLLHMVYYTTISALHRPLVVSPQEHTDVSPETSSKARQRVTTSAAIITDMATELSQWKLDRYLPTTGLTVLLPTVIIHMLWLRDDNPQHRARAWDGVDKCLRVMNNLTDMYAAADYATKFLDIVLKKVSTPLNRPNFFQDQTHLPTRRATRDPALNLMPGVSVSAPSGSEAAFLMADLYPNLAPPGMNAFQQGTTFGQQTPENFDLLSGTAYPPMLSPGLPSLARSSFDTRTTTGNETAFDQPTPAEASEVLLDWGQWLTFPT